MAGIYRRSVDGRLLDCNQALAKILGYESREELLRSGSFSYGNSSDSVMVTSALRELRFVSSLESALRRKDGTLAWVCENVALVSSPLGGEYIEGVLLEISDQRRQAERLEFQAHHDPLTELPNRALFVDRLSVALARARRQQKRLAIGYIDVDHFTLLNETFGSDTGDRVLKGLALRLNEALRIEDSIARVGSDEFAFLLSDYGSDENSALIAQRVLDTVSKPFSIDGREAHVNASVGLALYPGDGDDADTLLDHAANAMYRAKEVGRNTFQLYEAAMNARAFERSFLIASLRRAIDRSEFALHYQPQVNVKSGQIECIEALLRWNHPLLGAVEPSAFLPAAEEARLTSGIGEWVIGEALQQLRRWREDGARQCRIAVNLSAEQLGNATLPGAVQRALDEHRLSPDVLELEVSEAAIGNPAATARLLGDLKELGVTIALDDFGTGRCSMADVRRFPLDVMKIDASFVRNVTTDARDAAIVEAMITMAKGMKFRIIAEGVETQQQMRFLRDRNCLDMQGYFFGRPLPAASLGELLRMQH